MTFSVFLLQCPQLPTLLGDHAFSLVDVHDNSLHNLHILHNFFCLLYLDPVQ